MITVYKYEFPNEMQGPGIYGEFTMELPRTDFGFNILFAEVQGDRRYLWMEVDTDNLELITHKFCLIGTGKELPDIYQEYICSFRQDGFVWHLYESLDYTCIDCN